MTEVELKPPCDLCQEDINGEDWPDDKQRMLDQARGIDRECEPLDDPDDTGAGRRQSKWEGGL